MCPALLYMHDVYADRDRARKFYGRGPVKKKKNWFFRIFLLKKIFLLFFKLNTI
jgi:hypothetical protein